jgi:glycosyltransferase involved in cell wall biosynthesis
VKLTIGTTSCKNFAETWFTVQALRLFHDLADTEILIVDNAGDDRLRSFVDAWAQRDVRYVRWTDRQGTAPAKDRIFAEARGEWVIVIDSHVMLAPGAVEAFRRWTAAHPDCRDLLHGPMLYDDLVATADAMNDEWRGHMWGTWRTRTTEPDTEPYEIPMHGMGLFACRRDAWLGFNSEFRGFGGEEGYIHEKYRRSGRRVMCLPFLRWLHLFREGAPPYPLNLTDRIHNYRVGFAELGLDPKPIDDHFGRA